MTKLHTQPTSPFSAVINSAYVVQDVEPVLTIKEAAALLRWSPDSTRRFFKDIPGVLVKFQPKRYKRPYKHYTIPHSVFRREWRRMAEFNSSRQSAA